MIKMEFFTLLCCINPTSPIDDIDELIFYQIINPITTVVNIKIFNRDSQVKAFVQIKNEDLAKKILNNLHSKR